MQDCSNQLLSKLEKMENNIANLGKKNLSQDVKMEQINKSIYEIKEEVENLDKRVDDRLKGVHNIIKKRFDDISNGGFNPKSMKELKEEIKTMNVYLMDSYKLQAEKDKILVGLKSEFESTKRTKFSFWKAILVAGITVFGVKICEWIATII